MQSGALQLALDGENNHLLKVPYGPNVEASAPTSNKKSQSLEFLVKLREIVLFVMDL